MTDTSGPNTRSHTCGLALGSMILGILSLIIPVLGFLFAIPTVILGHIGLGKIGRSDHLKGKGFAISGLVTGYLALVFQLFLVLGMMLPAVAMARERARRVATMANLSQIGKACMAYSMDHQEQFPPDLRTLAAEDSYAMPGLFLVRGSDTTPGDLATVDTWTDFVYVPNLTASSPGNAVLVYTKPECYRSGGIVLYVDGSVRWLEKDEFDSTICGQFP